jgi:hypothetical protein
MERTQAVAGCSSVDLFEWNVDGVVVVGHVVILVGIQLLKPIS